MEPTRTPALRRLLLHTGMLLAVTVVGGPAWAGTCPVGLGAGAALGGSRPLPSNNPWNRDVSADPVDSRSTAIIARIGARDRLHPDFGAGLYDGGRIGIPYVLVPETQPKVAVDFLQWPDESDAGPYPIPPNAPIEQPLREERDRHVLVVQRDPSKPNCLGRLYELYQAKPVGRSSRSIQRWTAANGAVFDLNSNAQRPKGWTSADAAGLPIFPGLVRYDEVASGEIRHALRFTVPQTRKAYVDPARHWASYSTDPYLPPMGMRVRLKKSVAIPASWPKEVQVILRALKKYGMIVADNGGGWFISGAPDERWNNDELAWLGNVRGRDLEVVRMGTIVTK